jgi:hypothetical protein
MARIASIILTKEDKKAKLVELNQGIQCAKAAIKGIAASVKHSDAALKAATKQHADVLKVLDKKSTVLAKDLALLEAQKSALVNDTSVGAAPAKAPVGEPAKRTRRTKAEMEAFRASQAAA